jgi:GNAT superfamily N-acetyltransferase
MNIQELVTGTDIESCFDVYKELRPHLKDKQTFVCQVQDQTAEGFKISGIFEGNEIVACIGFRTMTTTAWGKILYVDDLITKEKSRGQGYGSALLKYAVSLAKDLSCDQVHLDTGFTRHAAHRVYLQHGFQLSSHHMSIKLK